MTYEILRGTKSSKQVKKAQKRAKSKSQRLVGKKITTHAKIWGDFDDLKVVIDPRKGWAD